ncbi:MAG: 1-acyl-sn-glycerol-3-phosphate acyltransferase [Prevotella sp.]|nr:1-acyl-sn-glycerol-3-phosphate acyltransferase [Prevotella sp.]MCR5152083.1 1-acyl-sn-glycerol-3-phosphate acyltransferase [Prevotella sp.]
MRFLYILRQTAYSVMSLGYFLYLSLNLTLQGFFIITLGGKTDENKLKYHRILQRKARFVINHVPGTTFQYSNPSDETFDKPAVIISNHQSHLDLMAIMMLTPKLIILTKDWVWKNPFYGIIIRYADYFPVSETEEMASNIESMVRKGYSVMIFPEGTRSEDCRIRRFHRGAFFIAEKLNLDIIPVFIDGFGKVLPKKSKHLHPGKMTLEVLPRIKREEMAQYGDFRSVASAMHKTYVLKKNGL